MSRLAQIHNRFVNSSFLPLAVILALALCIRLLMCFGSTGVLWPDSFAYFRSAALMAKYQNFAWHEIYRTPLFPFFMSPFLALGQNFLAGDLIIYAQRLLGLASIVIFYRIARQIFGPVVAFYSSLLMAVHTLQLYYETVVQTEALFVFMLYASIWQGLRLLRCLTRGEAIKLGVLLALLTLTRPLGQYTLLVFIFALACRVRNLRSFSGLALAIILPFALLLAPWMYVNKTKFGFFGVSQDIGLNLFHRVIDVEQLEPVKESAHPQIHYIWTKVKRPGKSSYFSVYHQLRRQKVSPLKADLMLKTVAIETFLAHPETFPLTSLKIFTDLFLSPRNSVHFCGSESGPYLCVPSTRGQSNKVFPNDARNLSSSAQYIIRQLFQLIELPFWLISPLAFLGMLICIRHRGIINPEMILCLGLVFCLTTMAAIINVPEDRFRLPIDPILFAFAIAAVAATCERLQKKLELFRVN